MTTLWKHFLRRAALFLVAAGLLAVGVFMIIAEVQERVYGGGKIPWYIGGVIELAFVVVLVATYKLILSKAYRELNDARSAQKRRAARTEDESQD